MKFWKIFMAIMVIKVLILSFSSFYVTPAVNYDEQVFEEMLNQSELQAQTSENQYVEQSLFFKENFKGGILDYLGLSIKPLGDFLTEIFPFGDKIPSVFVSFLNYINHIIFIIATFEFMRGINII